MRCRTLLVMSVAFWTAAADARPAYVPVVLGGGEVVILRAGNLGLRDWVTIGNDPAALKVRDRTGQWYRVRVSGHGACRFDGIVPVGAYGTGIFGEFGQGTWLQNTQFPYRRCLVRSVRPISS